MAAPTDVPVATPEAMGHTCAEWLSVGNALKQTTLAQFFTAHHYSASSAFIDSEILRINLDCQNTARVAQPIVQPITVATAPATPAGPARAPASVSTPVPWGKIAMGVGGIAVVGGVTWFLLSGKKRSK